MNHSFAGGKIKSEANNQRSEYLSGEGALNWLTLVSIGEFFQ